MGLFKRFGNVVGAKASATISAFEKPDEQLDFAYEKLIEEQKKVNVAVRDAIAAKNLKKRELNDTETKISSVHQKALSYRRRALDLEEKTASLDGIQKEKGVSQIERLNDTASQLLEEESRSRERVVRLKEALDNMEKKVRMLKDKQVDLKSKIQRFADKKDELKSDFAMAQASRKVNDALTGISGEIGDVDLTVTRMEAKIRKEQATADASDEMALDVLSIEDLEGLSDIEKELGLKTDLDRLDDELNKGV